jgi:hypothetical protein
MMNRRCWIGRALEGASDWSIAHGAPQRALATVADLNPNLVVSEIGKSDVRRNLSRTGTIIMSKAHLSTARTFLRVARSMTDKVIADRLKMLAGEYERRAGQARGLDTGARRRHSAFRPKPVEPQDVFDLREE